MVIDDSLTVRRIIEGTLKRDGFSVVSFENGLDAIRALTLGETAVPDLVFLDIGLPEMDGYNIAKIFRQKQDFEHTVIVMISGHSSLFNKVRGRWAGAQDYITKPFKPGEVLAVAHSLLHTGRATAR